MGVFSAALGISCEDCHGAATTWEGYAEDKLPIKQTARRMMLMMQAINKANFGGRQMVTCYSCHRGSNRPKVTSDLAAQYGPAAPDPNDEFNQAPSAPSIDQILDKIIQASGGAQRLAAFTGFTAKGTSLGYGPEGERAVDVFAKAPGQRTTILHTDNGDSTTVIDGQNAWIAPALGAVPLITLVGQDLEGARLEAALTFPVTARIKQALSDVRVGFPDSIDDREVQRVQGTTPAKGLVTLYFDSETGLLRRLVRYADSPVGRLIWQTDYFDYREVPKTGVRIPFRWTQTWLNGREQYTLTSVEPNATIEPAKFARPAPPTPK
jgi:hypothetical protein